MFENHIVGVIRFSFPALAGFQKAPRDPAASRAYLYDPSRLERRFRLFEALALPSLEAQTDPEFQVAVVIGEDFPEPWRERLETLLKRLPQSYLVALEPMINHRATLVASKRAEIDGMTHITTFRIDDDDALDRNFVARLKRTALALAPLNTETAVAISPNRGFVLEIGDGASQLYDVVERLPPGSGPALVVPVRWPVTVFAENHRKLAERFNTYSDAEVPAFIRTVHRDNDSNAMMTGRKNLLSEAEIAELVPKHFPFTVDELRKI